MNLNEMNALVPLWERDPEAVRNMLAAEAGYQLRSFPTCQIVKELRVNLFGSKIVRINFNEKPAEHVFKATWKTGVATYAGYTFVYLHHKMSDI
jgi:hypothetical protein